MDQNPTPEDLVLEATDHYYKGDFQLAIKSLDKAIEIKPDFAQAWYNKAITYSVMGHVQDEINCYDKAIEINPEYAEAWSNKSSALGRAGRLEEALDSAEHAIEIKTLICRGVVQ